MSRTVNTQGPGPRERVLLTLTLTSDGRTMRTLRLVASTIGWPEGREDSARMTLTIGNSLGETLSLSDRSSVLPAESREFYAQRHNSHHTLRALSLSSLSHPRVSQLLSPGLRHPAQHVDGYVDHAGRCRMVVYPGWYGGYIGRHGVYPPWYPGYIHREAYPPYTPGYIHREAYPPYTPRDIHQGGYIPPYTHPGIYTREAIYHHGTPRDTLSCFIVVYSRIIPGYSRIIPVIP